MVIWLKFEVSRAICDELLCLLERMFFSLRFAVLFAFGVDGARDPLSGFESF